MRGLRKQFAAVRALHDVDVDISQGTVHALVGENGAGKSTLGRIISGVIRPDAGTVAFQGRHVEYGSPKQALADGITTISQEIALLTKQTVLQNVMLGQEATRAGFLDHKSMTASFERLVEMTGFDIDPNTTVGTLRLADQKKVEVMQAIARDAKLIVMDEPTAMLADDETQSFLAVVRQLHALGRTIVYISHFLDEVLEIADVVTVMRNGEVVRTASTEQETPTSLIESMLGQSMGAMYPQKPRVAPDAPIRFSVENLTTDIFEGIDLELRAGEIVGLAGLVGSGRSRLIRSLFGAEPIRGGTVRVGGVPVRLRSTADAIKAGIHMLPESRKEQGLLLKQTILQNVSAPHLDSVAWPGGMIRGRRERERVRATIESLDVRPPDPSIPVQNLSGGNQQKVLFAKWLFTPPAVFLIDEPTRGVDVGAKQAIYELIVEQAKQGMPILLASSEIEEILGLCHRVLVMREGRLVGEFAESDRPLEVRAIMKAAFGKEDVPPSLIPSTSSPEPKVHEKRGGLDDAS